MSRVRSIPGALVALALVALGGASVVACGESGGDVTATRREADSTDAPASAMSVPASPATTVPLTSIVATSIVATTVAAPTTAEPTTSAAPPTTAAWPEGSIDVGSGVHLVPPDGWSVDWDDLGPILTDGVDHAALEVHVQPPGEDPAVVLQAYVDEFDAAYDTVAYSAVTMRNSFGSGATQVDQYGLYYLTYDAAEGIGWFGGLFAMIRADGLTVVLDVWNAGDGGGLPDDAAAQVRQSLLAAPAVAGAVELLPRAPFRLASVHPAVVIDGTTAFTPAPGFELVDDGDGWGRVSNGQLDAELHALAGAASLDDVMSAGDAVVGGLYTDVVPEPDKTVEEDLADLGYVRRSIPWTGLWAVDGTACGGTTTGWWGAAAAQSFVYVDAFVWMDDGSIPNDPESWFMFESAAMSLPPAGDTAAIAPAVALSR